MRVLGILRPCPTETSSTLFPGDKLIFVAEQLPTSGKWKAFYVGGSSLVPIGEETSRGLTPSSELSLLAAANVTAIHKAIMNLLHKKSLGKDDVAFLSPISASLNQTAKKRKVRAVSKPGKERQQSPAAKRTKAVVEQLASPQDCAPAQPPRTISPTNVAAVPLSPEARSSVEDILHL